MKASVKMNTKIRNESNRGCFLLRHSEEEAEVCEFCEV